MQIKTVGVLGCGLMGAGIAQTTAKAGYKTIVREINSAALEGGLGRLKASMEKSVQKGKLPAATRDAILANLTGTIEFEPLAECDVVIEAIVESVDEKRRTYAAVEQVLGDEALLVSNTSSLCITELASLTKRADRFAGLHFFNPVPLMSLVEVIRGLATSDATVEQIVAFARSLGKEPVTAPDRPGFIVNRLLIPYLLDAIRAYENGLGSLEDIDKAMSLGCGHPMGPFALLDFIGLDTTYYIANIMFDEFRAPAYAAPPLLKRMVLAGRLGRKSGRGFFEY